MTVQSFGKCSAHFCTYIVQSLYFRVQDFVYIIRLASILLFKYSFSCSYPSGFVFRSFKVIVDPEADLFDWG
jgi:hypothetical protein